MKILAISQRVENIYEYSEKRDCLDQRWTSLIHRLGFLPLPLSNLASPSEFIENITPSAIILSGGNNIAKVDKLALDVSTERDKFEERLIKIAIKKNIPIIGVCRGMQMINLFFDGSMSQVVNHTGVKHEITFVGKYLEEESREVNSYHRWCIQEPGLGRSLVPLAIANDGTVESFYHEKYPILGFMWHPEREEPHVQDDLNLIKKFVQS